eukprot:TRINITY_DN35201_c0_g1_i1.p1 TRINITY_DN35201_c0_g1~~TRINITY_DN35201_c0_g1_i1.p1  ORF type:complete len:125 (+),score=0.81 TRINITY_DN35201_c0_g1_i1:17-391(+)
MDHVHKRNDQYQFSNDIDSLKTKCLSHSRCHTSHHHLHLGEMHVYYLSPLASLMPSRITAKAGSWKFFLKSAMMTHKVINWLLRFLVSYFVTIRMWSILLPILCRHPFRALKVHQQEEQAHKHM